jgi:hypothetical protein
MGDKTYQDKSKPMQVRLSNIAAAKCKIAWGRKHYFFFCLARADRAPAVADCVRTSLGPKGMDKMVSPCLFPSPMPRPDS